MNMSFAQPENNFKRTAELFSKAAEDGTDTVVFPETWNTGFFPHLKLKTLSDVDGKLTKAMFGELCANYKINAVAGSVSNIKNGKVFNTSYVFDRDGNCIAEYDKTHLFTPMGEHEYYTAGTHTSEFVLDGKRCAVIICYDLRFPELIRTMTAKNRLDYLFAVSQWPDKRIGQYEILLKARAIENQMFVAACNSCGTAGETVFGGHSGIYSPLGDILCLADGKEEIISACCDDGVLNSIRSSINVFNDRREELYNIKTK